MLQRDTLGEEGAERFLPLCQCSLNKTFLTSLRPVTHLIGEFGGEIRCMWPSPSSAPPWSQSARRERALSHCGPAW